jgi:hypothetical protein
MFQRGISSVYQIRAARPLKHKERRSYPFASARPAKERQAAAGEQGRQGDHRPAEPGGEARGGRGLGQGKMAPTGNDDAFKYDIAFSFVGEDEGLATQLNDRLQDRYRTFLYSKAQQQLAGTDGEKTFNAVFEKEARIVAVLLLGHTAWTRIEEAAIRNRAHEQGYDFTTFIVTNLGLRFPIGCPGHVSGTISKGLDLTGQPQRWKREFKTVAALRSRRRLPIGCSSSASPRLETTT